MILLYIVGTVVVVFGGVALLVFLALSSNRGISTQPQSQPTQQPQGDSAWKKWGEYTGWGFFGLVLFDVYRKIFGNLPVEWKEWIPGFSWNTLEIIIAIIGVVVLWGKREKREKKETNGEKPVASENTTPTGNNRFAEKVVIMLLMIAGIFFWATGAIPYDDVPPIPAEGMLFVPTWGLLKAFLVGTFFATLWSFFDETGTTNGACFAVLLVIACLFTFFFSVKGYWFAPVAGDPFVSSVTVFIGIAILWWIICRKMKNAVEYVVIVGFVAVAIWLPQLVSKSPGLLGLAHALFR